MLSGSHSVIPETLAEGIGFIRWPEQISQYCGFSHRLFFSFGLDAGTTEEEGPFYAVLMSCMNTVSFNHYIFAGP